MRAAHARELAREMGHDLNVQNEILEGSIRLSLPLP